LVVRPESLGRQTGTNVPIEPNEEPIEEPIEGRDSLRRLDLGEKEEGRREVDLASQPGSNNTDDGFPEFYATYPKKKARADALMAYRGALKKGATPAELLAGALRAAAEYRIDVQRRGKELAYQYVAHPAGWLRKERWADEPAPTRGAGPLGRPDHAAVAEQIARQLMEKDGAHVVQ
jgi:hypothetical protein